MCRVEGFESHVAATKAQVSAERFRCFMDRCRAASSEAARSAARSMRRRGNGVSRRIAVYIGVSRRHLGVTSADLGRSRRHVGHHARTGEDGSDGEPEPDYEVERILDMQVRDDGTLWYLVEYCSAECDEGEEPSWQPAEYLAGCPDKIAAFFTDPEFRAPNCKYNHNKCVCRCRATGVPFVVVLARRAVVVILPLLLLSLRCGKPLWHAGQDKTIFKAFAYAALQWVVCGVRGLRKKSEGPGDMLSGFQDEIRGFGFPLTSAELAKARIELLLLLRPGGCCGDGAAVHVATRTAAGERLPREARAIAALALARRRVPQVRQVERGLLGLR